jgi:shikimate dehydrogenase
MQNAGLAALGLNWRYLACEVRPEELRCALEGAKAMRLIGVNLTVPHKVLALGMLDALDESATKWGAVNTVRFEARDPEGVWRGLHYFENTPAEVRSQGFNTDADAIVQSVEEDLGLRLRGGRLLLLGAGGAGRTAALRLAVEGPAEMFLINRTSSKAERIADEIGERFPGMRVKVGYPEGSVDLVLNATSLGLGPEDALPYDQAQFELRRAGAVYDMVYRPAETPLLKAAARAGCRTANGLSMLLYQGARALEIWSGKAAPIAAMRQALERNVYG